MTRATLLERRKKVINHFRERVARTRVSSETSIPSLPEFRCQARSFERVLMSPEEVWRIRDRPLNRVEFWRSWRTIVVYTSAVVAPIANGEINEVLPAQDPVV